MHIKMTITIMLNIFVKGWLKSNSQLHVLEKKQYIIKSNKYCVATLRFQTPTTLPLSQILIECHLYFSLSVAITTESSMSTTLINLKQHAISDIFIGEKVNASDIYCHLKAVYGNKTVDWVLWE